MKNFDYKNNICSQQGTVHTLLKVMCEHTFSLQCHLYCTFSILNKTVLYKTFITQHQVTDECITSRLGYGTIFKAKQNWFSYPIK